MSDTTPAGPPPLLPVPHRLEDDRIFLAPVTRQDHPFLYQLSIDTAIASSWRFRGHVPSFEEFSTQVNQAVLTQFVVGERAGGEGSEARIGHVVAYNADLRNGHCAIAVAMAAPVVGLGAGMRALTLIIDHVFATWNFHKLYAEVPDFVFDGVEEGLSDSTMLGFQLEGRFRDHVFAEGRHHDVHIVATYRSDWPGAEAHRRAWEDQRSGRA
ncbi:MAG TPA: GNAT family protein [Iamia sp.]|nr:GNAT family protein [Iamia sp.]